MDHIIDRNARFRQEHHRPALGDCALHPRPAVLAYQLRPVPAGLVAGGHTRRYQRAVLLTTINAATEFTRANLSIIFDGPLVSIVGNTRD